MLKTGEQAFESLKYSLMVVLLAIALTGSEGLSRPQSTSPPEGLGPALERSHAYLEEGNLEAALDSFRSALPSLRNTGDHRLLGETLLEMSEIATALGDYQLTREFSRESLSLWHEMGDRVNEASSYNNLGLADLYQGNYSAALNHYQNALHLDILAEDSEGEVLRLNNIANVYFYQGNYPEALKHYQEALGKLNRSAPADWKGHELQRTKVNLAVLYQKVGLYRKALDIYLEMRSTQKGGLTPSEEGRLLMNLGVLYRRLGDPFKALETYQEARTQFIRERHSSAEIGVLRNIGIVNALDLSDLSSAKRAFNEVLDRSAKEGNLRMLLHGYLYLGETELRLQRLEEAENNFGKALELAVQLNTVEEQWKADFGLGRVEQLRGNNASARRFFEDAIRNIESVRARLSVSSLKPGFLADKRDVYDALIELTFQEKGSSFSQQSAGNLFLLLERSKARTLQDQLRSSLERSVARRMPQQSDRVETLRAALSKLWAEPTGPEASTRAERRRLEEDLLKAEKKLYQSFRGLRTGQRSLQEMAALLNTGDVLLDFWISDQAIAAVYADSLNSGVIHHRVNTNFSSIARECLSAISDNRRSDWREACHPLSKELLSGLLGRLPASTDTLIIIPDRILGLIPVEALSLPDGSPLVRRFRVSYLPAASFLRTEMSARLRIFPWENVLLAVGDVAPGKTADSMESRPLPPLPYSGAEVREIAHILPGTKRLLFGQQARKAALFQSAIQRFPLLHLSTHAMIDLMNPERSRVLLSASDASGSRDYLFLGEVLDLQLEGTDLVTLSACDTARGSLIEGEGIRSFNSSFLLTGAAASLTSLWKIDDRATAEFMKQFYYQIASGKSKAAALRIAKLRFLDSHSHLAHPFYWASFVLYGEGRSTIPLPPSWGISLAVCSLGFAVIGLVIYMVQKNRR